jgi:predicted lipid-binding transport protein (Tim44 family)
VRHYIAPPQLNPVSRVLGGLLGLLVLVGAFFFGLIVLAAALALGLLAWLALTLRMWWLRRRWHSADGPGEAAGPGRTGAAGRRERDVIEADYEVISRRDDH